MKIHFHAGDDFTEHLRWKPILGHQFAQTAREIRFVDGAGAEPASPFCELVLLLGVGESGCVRDIIYHPAKGIERRHVVAPFFSERDKSEREVGFTFARDLVRVHLNLKEGGASATPLVEIFRWPARWSSPFHCC